MAALPQCSVACATSEWSLACPEQPRTQADVDAEGFATFKQPRGLSAKASEKTHWHNELASSLASLDGEIQKKVDTSIGKIEKQNGTHGVFVVQPIEPFQWNPSGGDGEELLFDVPGRL